MIESSKITTVLFDFDDTLGNREKYANDCYRAIVKANSNIDDPLRLESVIQDCMIWDQKGNVNKKYIQEKLKEKYHIVLPYDDFNTYWDQVLAEHTVLNDGVLPTLDYLGKKYQLGIITNGNSEGQRNKIRNSHLDTIFDMDKVVVSGDYGIHKPDTRIFMIACEKYHVKPEECVYIGDVFANDVQGAINTGMQAIWIWTAGTRTCAYDVETIHTFDKLMEIL